LKKLGSDSSGAMLAGGNCCGGPTEPSGQLDALIKQQIAAIDGRPSNHLILGQDPYVVRDDLSDPAARAPLPRAMKDPNVLQGRRCGHFATLS
jgi:hypothetical protein